MESVGGGWCRLFKMKGLILKEAGNTSGLSQIDCYSGLLTNDRKNDLTTCICL